MLKLILDTFWNGVRKIRLALSVKSYSFGEKITKCIR